MKILSSAAFPPTAIHLQWIPFDVTPRSGIANKILIAVKNVIHRVLNLVLYFAFCAMTGTGLLLAYRLHGSRGGRTLTVIGMDRHEWGNVHLWISFIAVAAVVAHLVMNWTWLKKIASSMKPLRLWGGLLAGILIVAVFVLLPVSNRRVPENEESERIREAQPD